MNRQAPKFKLLAMFNNSDLNRFSKRFRNNSLNYGTSSKNCGIVMTSHQQIGVLSPLLPEFSQNMKTKKESIDLFLDKNTKLVNQFLGKKVKVFILTIEIYALEKLKRLFQLEMTGMQVLHAFWQEFVTINKNMFFKRVNTTFERSKNPITHKYDTSDHSLQIKDFNISVSTSGERGDVPGWVLVVLMTAGLVTGIWTVAAPRLNLILRNSLDSMNAIR